MRILLFHFAVSRFHSLQLPPIDLICVRDMIVKLLSPLNKKQRKNIKPDRGPEFAKYKYFSRLCGIDCYFADPWPPWQPRTNENTNGLIRES